MFALVAAALAASVAAVVQATPPSALCCGWNAATQAELSVVSAPTTLSFALHLREQNMEKIRAVAHAVSDPDSPKYGEHLSREAVDTMTAPREADRADVMAWLSAHLGSSATIEVTRGRWIEVNDAPSAEASTLFGSEFVTLARGAERRLYARAYTLPARISAAVSAVYGISGVPLAVATPFAERADAPAWGSPDVTPDILKRVYNITGVTLPAANPGNKQAIVSFLGQTFSLTDLADFFTTYVGPDAAPLAKVTCVGKSSCTGSAENEASLDIQYLMGLSPGVATEGWYFGGQTLDFCGTVRAWTSTLLAATAPPLVSSVSYGYQGDLAQSGCTTAESQGVEDDLAKAAARGLTILFASGDSGNGEQDGTDRLYPSWPSTSPWVTAVGATEFKGQQLYTEQVAPTFTFSSGGGFSWENTTDAGFQATAVASYVATVSTVRSPFLPTPEADWNAGGRAVPDVAVLGEGYMVVTNGHASQKAGTSAATPAFAAIISLLNEARLNANMSAMGMINPWLYKHGADMFTDVTEGADSRNGAKDKRAFLCAPGYDVVTGLGTPIFPKMLNLSLAAGAWTARTARAVSATPAAQSRFADIVATVNSQPRSWTAAVPDGFNTPADVAHVCRTILPTDPAFAKTLPRGKRIPLYKHKTATPGPFPTSWDARTAWPNCTVIGHVMSQSACGDCWAVSATEVFESVSCIAGKLPTNIKLSKQDTAQCCAGGGCGYSKSCTAGTPHSAFMWFKESGVVTGGDYNSSSGCMPYELAPCKVTHNAANPLPVCHEPQPPPDLTCATKCSNAAYPKSYMADKHGVGSTIAVWGLDYKGEDHYSHTFESLMKNGPASATFSVMEDFPAYSGGVYQHTTGGFLGGHAVVLMGWGEAPNATDPSAPSVPYWLVKNSWSEFWGENGFFRILRGANEVGIESGLYGAGFGAAPKDD